MSRVQDTATPLAPQETFSRIATVREIPGRKVPTSVAHAFGPTGVELVVVERIGPKSGLTTAAIASVEDGARRSMTLRHPNVAAVRDVDKSGPELVVVAEFVEGESLAELRAASLQKPMQLEVGVRVVVDVLAALSALHTTAPPLFHGEMTAGNVIVGYDGVTRLVRAYHGKAGLTIGGADVLAYAAPEVIAGGDPDVRADLFAVGVLLWETLARRPLFPKATRESRTRTALVPKASVPADASWAGPLAGVAERALSRDPAARYASAAEMAAAVRLVVRSKLAMPPRVAATVDKYAGEKVLARRVAFALPETQETGARRSSVRPSVPPGTARVLDGIRPSSRPPTPRPGPVAVPEVPKAPRVPQMGPPPAPRPQAPPLDLTPAPRVKEAPSATDEPAPVPGIVPPPADLVASIADVLPPSSFEAEPISLDSDALVESVKPPVPVAASPLAAPAIATPAIATPARGAQRVASAPDAQSAPPPGLGAQRGRRILMVVGVLCLLLLAGAGIRALVVSTKPASPKKPTHATARHTATAPHTATVAVTAPPTATTAAPEDSAGAAPEDSASAAADDSASASAAPPPPDTAAPTVKRKPRPKATYDPEGI